jgi:hypothetical protein
MKYDYSFFREHCSRRRRLKSLTGAIFKVAVGDFLGDPVTNKGVVWEKKIDETTKDEHVIVHIDGGYVKGPGSSLEKLQATLRNSLPEDFIQFHEEFGESMLITRAAPLWFWNEEKIIDDFHLDFESDFDEEFPNGRFFRMVEYSAMPTLAYGLRQNDVTDAWEVVFPQHGVFYEEMIDVEGRKFVVADSFYEWLKDFVARDGYPDIYPVEETWYYSEPVD